MYSYVMIYHKSETQITNAQNFRDAHSEIVGVYSNAQIAAENASKLCRDLNSIQENPYDETFLEMSLSNTITTILALEERPGPATVSHPFQSRAEIQVKKIEMDKIVGDVRRR